jgi:hypothetical protein
LRLPLADDPVPAIVAIAAQVYPKNASELLNLEREKIVYFRNQ